MHMYQVLVLIAVMFECFGLAYGAELEKFVVTMESPVCGVRGVEDVMVSVCEWDDAKLRSGMCQETKPVYKLAKMKACSHIGNGPFPPDLPDQTGAVVGGANLKRAILALGGLVWPKVDLSTAGPLMPDGHCKEIGKKLLPYPPFALPGVVRRLDTEVPGWRECMASLATNTVNNLGSMPEIIKINRLQTFLAGLDISNPDTQAMLNAFVLAIEEESIHPVPWDRAMELLKISAN